MGTCDNCGTDGALRCHSYYDENKKEVPYEGMLCSQCHHGGEKKAAGRVTPKEEIIIGIAEADEDS